MIRFFYFFESFFFLAEDRIEATLVLFFSLSFVLTFAAIFIFSFFNRREITKTSKERKLGTYRLPRKHNIWSAEHRSEIWPEWRMTKKEVEQNYFFSVPLECREEFDLSRPSTTFSDFVLLGDPWAGLLLLPPAIKTRTGYCRH